MLPKSDQYYAQIQNPTLAFADTELRTCKPELDQLQLPKPYSGGFTTTYHLLNHDQDWAVRCFIREIPDLKRRYQSITRLLGKSPGRPFVKVHYLEQGIRVGNGW